MTRRAYRIRRQGPGRWVVKGRTTLDTRIRPTFEDAIAAVATMEARHLCGDRFELIERPTWPRTRRVLLEDRVLGTVHHFPNHGLAAHFLAALHTANRKVPTS